MESVYDEYHHSAFIDSDPICIPHRYTDPQDIEIAGLIAALLAWGQRRTIIAKAQEFIDRMDGAPADFVIHADAHDLQVLQSFRHRTFNGTDAQALILFLQAHYRRFPSLQSIFIQGACPEHPLIYSGLAALATQFKELATTPARSHKHISDPSRGSACKRLNMYLRWMVRRDARGVDFGLWSEVDPSELFIPLDTHVMRSAQQLSLIHRKQADWRSVVELTDALRRFDRTDPVRYDLALFHLSLMK